MRYIVQLLIPAMIIIVVALVLLRNRNSPASPGSSSRPAEANETLSTGTFVAILVIGATFTIALIYALHGSGN